MYIVQIKQGDDWADGLQFNKVENAMSVCWSNIEQGINSRVVDNKGNIIYHLDGEHLELRPANDN